MPSVDVEARRRAGRARPVAAACASGVVVLGVLIALGLTVGVDVATRDLFRPDDVWGTAQWRADVVVEGARPRNVAVLLAVAGVLLAVLRRSWRPVVLPASAGLLAVVSTLAVKFAVQRPDPHHEMSALGGSFPSGHTVMVIVGAGVLVLLLRSPERWAVWASALTAGAVMAVSLLLQAAHWLTDVVGGALLGVAVLAVVTASRARLWPDG